MRFQNVQFVALFVAVATLVATIQVHAVPITGGSGPGGVGLTDGTSALQLWLEADTLSALSDSDPITSWADSSGKTNTATQGTATAEPTYQSAGLNGRPAAIFDATNDHLDTANSVVIGTTESVFFATDVTSAGGDKAFLGNAGNGNYTLRDRGNGSTGWNLGGFSDGVTSVRSAPAIGTSPAILSGVRSIAGDTIALFGNGSTLKSTTHSSGNITGSYIVGARGGTSEFFNGALGEIITYNTNVNSAERTLVENYLSSKFDIAISNDQYNGDSALNGDYDDDVFGIGREDGSNEFISTGQAGFGLEAISSGAVADDDLNNGEYLLAGHNTATNGLTSANMSGQDLRWERVWYLDDGGDDIAATLGFGWSDSGLISPFDSKFNVLYYSPSDPFAFTSLAGASSVVGDQVFFSLTAGQLQAGYYTLGTAIPEPSSILLLGLGALGLVRLNQRRNRRE